MGISLGSFLHGHFVDQIVSRYILVIVVVAVLSSSTSKLPRFYKIVRWRVVLIYKPGSHLISMRGNEHCITYAVGTPRWIRNIPIKLCLSSISSIQAHHCTVLGQKCR